MKQIAWIFGSFILLSTSCGLDNGNMPYFKEKELSFLHLRFGYDKHNKWIKNPNNIFMLHETFKKIGYPNLISKEEWTNEWIPYLGINKSPKNWVDSLVLTYDNVEKSPTYYREFWTRRKKEGNMGAAYQVLKEISAIMLDKTQVEVNDQLVNDTLANLLSFEYPARYITDEEANSHLKYLIKIGLHQSAYNLRTGEYFLREHIHWDQPTEAAVQQLSLSESFRRPWYEDNTK